jgi:hypothetical protein
MDWMNRVWAHSDPTVLKSTVTSSAAEIECVAGQHYLIVSNVSFYYKWGATGDDADSDDMLWPAYTPLVERAGTTNRFFQVISDGVDGIIRMAKKIPDGV